MLAAAELGVTPGAISRQVKSLEDYLGFSLFTRVYNGIEVTPQAKAYQEALRESFLLMERSTKELLSGKRDGPLNVWCSRLFMRHWLVPRLTSFQKMYPDQEVVLTGGRSEDPLATDIDVAIRWGTGPWGNWNSVYLMDSAITPICSPEYLASHGPLEDPASVLDHTLLYSTTRSTDWPNWLTSVGVSLVGIQKKITFEGDGLTFKAALDGLGLGMARIEFLEPDLRAGRLVMPFKESLKLSGGFHLIYPQAYAYPRKVVAFRNWLLQEVKRPWHHDLDGYQSK